MKSTAAAVLLSAMAAGPAIGSPILQMRADMCDAVPAGSGSQTPLSQPTAATADVCRQQCTANTACLSYVFGLPSGASAPTCMLFQVAAASIPAQSANLRVFDKACTNIPTQPPTAASPVGPVPTPVQTQPAGGNNGNGANNGGASGQGGKNRPREAALPKDSNPPPPLPTTPPPPPAPQPREALPQGPGGAGAPRPPRPAQPQPPRPAKPAPPPLGPHKRNVCGAAPAGPSTNKPSPIKTLSTITTQQACLDACHQDHTCQAALFGTFQKAGPTQCELFSVPAAQLPAPTTGQSFVAFDTGC